MSKQNRWNQITEICHRQDKVSVEELVHILQVSPATIRRDLQEMEDQNLILRYHGGAMISDDQSDEPAMIIKNVSNIDAKKQIAFYAAKRIQDNQMIYIDAGSTTLLMLDYITARNITVVTTGIPHLSVLGKKKITTIVPGGTLRWGTQALSGKLAVKNLSEMYFDACFVGTNGIHEHIGFTTANEMEAETKSTAIHQSKNAYILTDHTKFNLLCPVQFAELKDAEIICDYVQDFDKTKIKVTEVMKHD